MLRPRAFRAGCGRPHSRARRTQELTPRHARTRTSARKNPHFGPQERTGRRGPRVECMQTRMIGDRTVSAIGLGTMPLSRPHHATGTLPDRRQAVETVQAALDAGVTLIDCADCYAPDEGPFGHNEELVAEALRRAGNPDVLVATKGGIQRDG